MFTVDVKQQCNNNYRSIAVNRLNAAGDKSAAVVIYLNLQRDFVDITYFVLNEHFTDSCRVKMNLKSYTL